MARIRTIKPEFFTSEDIVALGPWARLLYVALWCEADREGRMLWKPRTFKMRYFPADDIDVQGLCAELTSAGLVVLYGDGLAYIPSFSRHQHVNPRESKSELPDPPPVDNSRVIHASARVSDAQGGREGREGSTKESPDPDGSAAGAASLSSKAELWRASVSVLTQGGCPEAQARPFMGKLVKDYGEDTVRDAVASAVSNQPAEAREYLKATCQRLKGERKDPVTVPSAAADETARYLAEQANRGATKPPAAVLALARKVTA